MKKLYMLLLLGASAASSAIIVPAGITITVGGVNETSLFNLPSITGGHNAFRLAAPVVVQGVFGVSSLTYSSFDDPNIVYSMAVQNLSAATQTFSFTFINPYIGGPYTTLTDSFTDQFSDGNFNGTVTVGLVPPAVVISQPQVDGVNRDGQGVGCTQTGVAGFSSACNPGPSGTAISIPATSVAGTFGTVVSFTLSPGDTYTFSGTNSLAATSTPEPATYYMMAAGFGLLLFASLCRKKSDVKV